MVGPLWPSETRFILAALAGATRAKEEPDTANGTCRRKQTSEDSLECLDLCEDVAQRVLISDNVSWPGVRRF
eukprot:s138_g27.t1